MACALTSDLDLGCRDSVGGIKTIYVTELANKNTLSANASGVITTFTLTSGKQFFIYSLEKEHAALTENTVYDPANGTKFSEQSLTFTVHKLQSTLRQELTLLIQNRVMVIILDRNGKYWLLGQANGMDVTTIEAVTGQAFGDNNGYNLTLVGKEEAMIQEVDSSLISTLTAPA